VLEAQFANATDKWYFRHINYTKAGSYRIIFDALPAKAAAPEAKRAKRQDAEPRIKSIDRAVLRWTQTAASIRKIEAKVGLACPLAVHSSYYWPCQLIYPEDGKFRLNPNTELLVQVAWKDRYGNRCTPYEHPALPKQSSDDDDGVDWTPDVRACFGLPNPCFWNDETTSSHHSRV
jgi:hypothetical protein